MSMNPAIMGRYLQVVKGGTMIPKLPEHEQRITILEATVADLQKQNADLRTTVARLEQVILAHMHPISNNKYKHENRTPSFL